MSCCNGSKDLLPALGVSSFSILTFALELGIQLRQLISLCANRIWIGDALSVFDLFGQRVDSCLQALQLSLARLKLAIKRAEQTIESGDTGFRIEKSVRINHGHLAVGDSHGAVVEPSPAGLRESLVWFVLTRKLQ